jgi:hypothetical protein
MLKDVQSCPRGSKLFLNKCYKVKDHVRLPWSEALVACQNMGGNLASIGSDAEQRFVNDLISSRRKSDIEYWIGTFHAFKVVI